MILILILLMIMIMTRIMNRIILMMFALGQCACNDHS